MRTRFCKTTIMPGLPSLERKPSPRSATPPAGASVREDADLSFRLARLVGDIEFLVEHTVEPKDVVGILAWRLAQIWPESKAHGERVGRLAGRLALRATEDLELSRNLSLAARLHDIGKVCVPDRILNKKGLLTDEETELMRKHALVGFRVLRGRDLPLLEQAAWVAGTHHEWWDGTGYPFGLQGAEIPLAGRITAIADVYDALIHPRPYRDALPLEGALGMMEEGRGTQFEPDLLDHLWRHVDEELAG